MIELSICIPARQEEWLVRTVEDLLQNTSDKTEILVGLDGYWPEPGLPDDPRVRILHVEEPIGQRAMQNRLVRMSKAKYVAKADAHCAFDSDFDTKMLSVMEDDITLAPLMRNLHVFDWVCENCDMRTYQGPAIDICRNEICDTASDSGQGHAKLGHRKELVWKPKPGVRSSAYRFNKNLQFKYFPELRAKLPRKGLQETMSLQGSFFMCTRVKYWELNLCDETWGSWGQQGSEVALKTWLSGGRVLSNLDTWYAHLFRTQDGFSWPYGSPNTQNNARKISQDIFLNDKWNQAIHPLSWLLEKFWFALQEVKDPEARWEEGDLKNYKRPPSREIIYYTAHQKPIKVARMVQDQLKTISKDKDIPIRSVTLKPMDKMGENIHLPLEPGKITYFQQIITALRTSTADIVYMCEDDVLYHPSHFDYLPEDKKLFYYDQNWWKIRVDDGFAAHWDANQVSGLVAYREHLLAWYRDKLENIMKKGFDRRYEPGGRNTEEQVAWFSDAPNIDIRTGGAMTANKWSLDDFRDKSTAVNFMTSDIANIPGWQKDELQGILKV